MTASIIALILGFLLDLLIGDPHFLYHPIRLVGNLIAFVEKGLRRIFPKTEKGELGAGVALVILVVGITTGIAWGILLLAGYISPILRFVLEIIMCYQLLATKSLKTESMKVYDRLKTGDLEGSRYAVSMIVGRDTKNLTAEGVTKAAVETVAENTSDGIIAPMLFMAIGGVPLGYLYKAINTMDSMVGYKNDKYLFFGRASAKLDDFVNYIPARITAWLMIAATKFIGLHTADARRIFKRDRYNHASPNSAQTEAVMAGALQIQLAGDACYFGKIYKKPTIGDPIRPVVFEDIRTSNRLLYATAVLSIIVFSIIKLVAIGLYTGLFG